MSKRRDPEWRNRAAVTLLMGNLSGFEFSGPVLVMDEPLPDLTGALLSSGVDVTAWNRRAIGGGEASPWPPAGPFCAATLRLPRGREELTMDLYAAASGLEPGGVILVYGAKDEGIQAALDTLEPLFRDAETSAIGGRCRVLRGVRGSEISGLRGSLDDWRTTLDLDSPHLPSGWVSYPGVFAHGRLDGGTRLLLEALPSLAPGARILDYGCGSGVVGYVARGRGKDLVVEMSDVDTVALEAARENVEGSPVHLHDGLPPVEVGPFDAILSNPPFHRGKAEDPEMILSMIRGAPYLLRPRGVLVFVAQRRLSVEGAVHSHFQEVSILAEDSTYRVWQGRRPRKGMEKG